MAIFLVFPCLLVLDLAFFTCLYMFLCNELFVTKFAVAQYFLVRDVKPFKEGLKDIKASYMSASTLL